MEIGEVISYYRRRCGLTIDELAAKSGVPKGTLNKIMNGVTNSPKIETVQAIARALNVTLADIDSIQNSDGIEKSPETATTAPEEISDEDLLTAALTNIGLIKSGYDLTAEDAKFVSGVFDILESWFAKQEKERP